MAARQRLSEREGAERRQPQQKGPATRHRPRPLLFLRLYPSFSRQMCAEVHLQCCAFYCCGSCPLWRSSEAAAARGRSPHTFGIRRSSVSHSFLSLALQFPAFTPADGVACCCRLTDTHTHTHTHTYITPLSSLSLVFGKNVHGHPQHALSPYPNINTLAFL